MLHTIIGLMNSGKTWFCTLKLFIDWCNGRKIITNYDVFFPHTKINMEDLENMAKEQPELPNVSMGLDELWIWLDARSSMSNTPMTYLFLQSSKGQQGGTNIYLTAQDDRQLDIRLRDNQHFLTICSRKLIIGGKKIKINDSIRELPIYLQQYLYICAKTYTQKIVGFDRKYKLHSKINYPASVLFSMYDTHLKMARR